MLKKSARYITLALTLVVLTATVRTAHAQSDDPCTDPTNPACVITGTEPPPPTGKVVTQNPANPALADGNSTDGSQSMNDLTSYLIMFYGLA